ncbi:hypothetical protein A3860_32850 [Niastella vici]|uniref:Uncharacterized protein n=1 Tax=Niastella vici TaxID=1703345 RepID=A0A1V9FQG0_9BACT|nr:hypothetical protein [Niastella vici]OQP60605.1 hypothetical protein A3860_32850 [Niastella vici]
MKVKWIIAMSSVGIAAYILADIFHEVVGHGGTCVIIGHKIDLITSVYFKSTPGSFLTDIGGPIANLLFGLLVHTLLKKQKSLSLLSILFLLNLMAYNLCWFSGTILQSGFSKTGDWTYTIKELNIGALGKPVLIIAGVIAYLLSMKIIRVHVNKIGLIFAEVPLRQSVVCSYFAAAITAIVSGLFFKYDRTHAAIEGLLEMLGSLPIIFIIPGIQTKVNNYELRAGPIVTVSVFILFITFCFTLGRGMS